MQCNANGKSVSPCNQRLNEDEEICCLFNQNLITLSSWVPKTGTPFDAISPSESGVNLSLVSLQLLSHPFFKQEYRRRTAVLLWFSSDIREKDLSSKRRRPDLPAQDSRLHVSWLPSWLSSRPRLSSWSAFLEGKESRRWLFTSQLPAYN